MFLSLTALERSRSEHRGIWSRRYVTSYLSRKKLTLWVFATTWSPFYLVCRSDASLEPRWAEHAPGIRRLPVGLSGGEAARGVRRAGDPVDRMCRTRWTARSLWTPGPGGEDPNQQMALFYLTCLFESVNREINWLWAVTTETSTFIFQVNMDVLQSLTGDGVMNVQEFVSRVLNQNKPPTPSASTPYRQLKRHHSTQVRLCL